MNINLQIKKEADEFLYDLGLMSVLQEYTHEDNIFISGSYKLDTMAWRDIDIYMDINNITQDIVYEMMFKFIGKFRPVWYESKDSFKEDTGCPKGYFIGFETFAVCEHLWNVDIWITDRNTINDNIEMMSKWLNLLDNDSRNEIVKKKQELMESGEYGESVFSVDIYNTVLNIVSD